MISQSDGLISDAITNCDKVKDVSFLSKRV